MRILIADDHPAFRRGIQEFLAERLQPVQVSEAASGTEMLAFVEKHEWDVAIMDITMPGISGTDLLHELKRLRPTMPVLVMSVHPVQAYAVRMIRSGASGYLTKIMPLEELIAAIKTVLTGRNYITPAVAEYLAASLQAGPGKELHAGLSHREFQVFRMLAQGKTLKEIAHHCRVSPNTVSTYRARVLEKLKATNNAQLTCYAIENSLIDYP